MAFRRFGIAIAIVAGMASAARSQTIPTPYIYGVPVTPPDWFTAHLQLIGPQLPGESRSVRPANANGQPSFYPTQVEQAYGLATLQGGLGSAAKANAGAGQTIAIIDAYNLNNALSGLNTFSAGYNGLWSLPAMSASGTGPTFTVLNQSGGTSLSGISSDSGWNGEESLDIDYVHAMAPLANIILYEAANNSNTNLYAALNAARNNPNVSVVTMSWSGPESSGETSNDSTYFTTPGTKATAGVNITFTASTGDEGDINESPGNGASGYPATSKNVVAVGGTSLYLNTNSSYNHETAWGWNSSYQWGGGGGTSAYEPKPSWQTTYGSINGGVLGAGTTRAEPDVSLLADPITGVYIYDPATPGWETGVGGTSLSSPLFAGLIADADGMRAAAGHPTLAGTQTLSALYLAPSSDFNNITSGNISPTGNTNFSSTGGYSLATGLGSPIANLLVPYLAGFGITSTSYSLTASPAAVNIHVASASTFASTTITGSLTNTGSSSTTSDSLSYGGFGLTASGGTLSGGNLPLGTGTAAVGHSTSGTKTFSSNTAGSFTITPSAVSVLNMVATGTPFLSGSGSTTVTVYRLAAPGTIAGLTFNGNYHVGDSVAPQVLTVSNTAANDGYSEGLDASFGVHSSGLIVSGSTGLIGAGASDSSSLQVGINTASAGAESGTVFVTLTSDGTGTSGLGTTSLTAQIVGITAGNVYRLAAPALGPTTFNMHLGSAGTGALIVANTAANDNFSESLDASFGSVSGALVPSGSIALLASGGSSAAMSLAMSTSAVGSQSGSVTLNFTSDGTGTSGLGLTSLNSQTFGVTGNVYRLAAPGTLAPISFGTVHVGANAALIVANTAANDGWSEALDASFGSASGGLAANGSVSLLASGGSSAAMSLTTSAAGPQAGTVTVNFTSDGTGTSGLGLTSLNSQTIGVTGTVYRLAAPGALAPISFGNVHVGATAPQQALIVSNTAANDGWSEALDASFGSVAGGLVSSGSVGLLASGGSSNAMSLAMVTSAAGHQGGNVTLSFISDGTGSSGLGLTALASQTVSVTGNVYRLAAPGALAPISLGNVHVGAPQALIVANTATNDGFSEALDASFGSVASGLVANGSVSLLASGGSSAAMSLAASAVGPQGGNVTVNFTSDGTGSSGLGLTSLGSQTISVTGNAYRLAAASALGPISFGNVHLGSTAAQALVIANTAASDGWSESLDAGFGSVAGGLLSSGSVGLLTSGGSSTAMSLAMVTSAAGHQGGNVSVNFTSDGTGSSGLGLTSLGSQTISATGNVYRLAAPSTTGPISLGNVHVGATAPQQALIIANTAVNDGWSESLDASFGSVGGGLLSSGSIGLLASGGSSNAMSLAMVTSAAGPQSGNVTVNFVSDGTGSSGLGLTALGSQTISVTGNVYSGQGVWNTNGGGSWTDFSKWTTLGGVPGIDGALSAGDTALFGAALSAGSATVSLNGASPHVSSLTFSTTAKYTVAQGTGGTLNLDAGAGTATIAVLAGNHAIASPVTLVSAANFTQAAGSSLTISGAIGTVSTSGASSLALSQAGPGLLVLGGANTYFGPTTVSGGVLSAANPNTLSSNSDMFVGGGSLVVTAGPQTVKSLTIGPAGTLNVSVGNLLTSLNAATFGDGTLNVSNYTLGTTEELIAYGSHANPGSDAFLSFTVDGSNSTGYQLEYQANELEIAPVPNTSMLVPSTSALGFGRVLSTAVGTLPVTVGLSGGTTSTGATAAVFTGGLQGATITSATSSGPGYITASQNWTVNVGLGVGLGAHSDTVVIQNTGNSGTGPTGTAGPPPTGNQQGPIDVAVSGTVVSKRTVNAPAVTALPGTWQGSYHAGDAISAPVTFGYSYPGGGSGSLNDTESASVAAYSGGADANGVTLAGSPNSITSSAAFTRNFTGTATVGSGSGNFTLNVTPELSSSATVTAAYTISVTSGSMNWSGPSGGSWSTGGWTDTVAGGAPVAPGLNPSWTHSDVAKFGSGAGSATTVNLDVSPSLAAVAFSGTTAYKLAAAGGTLTLNNAGNGASIAANASAPSVINAPLVLADNLTVSGSGTLEFGPTGTITDNGAGKALILNAAGGILELSGSNSYSGGTTVADGTLIAAENEAIQDGTNLYVGSGLSAFFGAAVPAQADRTDTAAQVSAVPEPGALALLVAAGTLLLIRRRRRRAIG